MHYRSSFQSQCSLECPLQAEYVVYSWLSSACTIIVPHFFSTIPHRDHPKASCPSATLTGHPPPRTQGEEYTTPLPYSHVPSLSPPTLSLSQAPYAWTLGDGSTISGLELAISGGDGVPPMLPGGVRRVIIPSNAQSNLAYAELARPNKNALQVQDCSTGKGPIPPNAPQASSDMGAGEFQRFKNIYCNANRPYQPDLVMDVKLFGKRS